MLPGPRACATTPRFAGIHHRQGGSHGEPGRVANPTPAMLKGVLRNRQHARLVPRDTGDGHHHFFQTFSRLGSARRSQAQVLAEIVRRNRYQNVNYVSELMMNAGAVADMGGGSSRSSTSWMSTTCPAAWRPFEPLIEDSRDRSVDHGVYRRTRRHRPSSRTRPFARIG